MPSAAGRLAAAGIHHTACNLRAGFSRGPRPPAWSFGAPAHHHVLGLLSDLLYHNIFQNNQLIFSGGNARGRKAKKNIKQGGWNFMKTKDEHPKDKKEFIFFPQPPMSKAKGSARRIGPGPPEP